MKKGEPVLRFDTDTLERLLAEKRAELDEATKKVEQKEVDLRLKLLDLEQRTAQARAELTKAELKADAPAVAVSLARAEGGAARQERAASASSRTCAAERRVTDAIAGSELRSLRQQRDRAQGRVQALEAAIEAMTVRAPQDGHRRVTRPTGTTRRRRSATTSGTARWCSRCRTSSEMKGDGFVDEADGGPVAEGQPVMRAARGARRLRPATGRVTRIARTVRKRSWRTPVQGLPRRDRAREDGPHLHAAGDALPRRDRDRPPARAAAGAARGGVPARAPGRSSGAGRALGWRETSVELGRSNRTQVEVLSGLPTATW